MPTSTHSTVVMHTAMIQPKFTGWKLSNSDEYWNMYRHVFTMYIHICKFPFMYMTRTGIYINVQTCMYICLFVHTWYIHVHTMYVHI